MKKLLLLILLGACQKVPPQHLDNQLLALGDPWRELPKSGQILKGMVRDYQIGHRDSIKQFKDLSAVERALLLISTDNFSAENKLLEEKVIPYVAAASPDLKFEAIVQSFHTYKLNGTLVTLPAEKTKYQNLVDFFATATENGRCQTIIPFHPDTIHKPWLVERELRHQKRKNFDLVAFPSMSRSLFVLNTATQTNGLPLLFSIKVGTDTVPAATASKQPEKLKGLQKHVARVNLFNELSSIPELLTQADIFVLSDSAGINFYEAGKPRDADDFNNGIIIRAYDVLLQDKSRIYMPLAKYLEMSIDDRGPYWELYKNPESTISLRVEESMLKSFSQHLAHQFGKLKAIYYANGFTSRDLHGQNVMVGVPLDPAVKPLLVIRDLSDHAQFPMMVGGERSNVLYEIRSPTWETFEFKSSAGVKKTSQVFSPAISDQLETSGYQGMLDKLDFKLKKSPFMAYAALSMAQPGSDLVRDVMAVRARKTIKPQSSLPTAPVRRIAPRCMNRMAPCVRASAY